MHNDKPKNKIRNITLVIVLLVIVTVLAMVFSRLSGIIYFGDDKIANFEVEANTPYTVQLGLYESAPISDDTNLEISISSTRRTVYSSLYEMDIFRPPERVCKANNRVMRSLTECCQAYGWDRYCLSDRGSMCCGKKEFTTDNLIIRINNVVIFNNQNMETGITYKTEQFGQYVNQICGYGEQYGGTKDCDVSITFLSTGHSSVTAKLIFKEGVDVTFPDTDGDGIGDDKDACIYEKEIINGYKDEDGCPDTYRTYWGLDNNNVCIEKQFYEGEIPENELPIFNTEEECKIYAYSSLIVSIQELADYINSLDITLEEQAKMISDLELSISKQAELINALTSVLDEQAIIITALELNINEQAEIINELTTKHKEQAIIISNMELNIQQQAELIKQLTTKIEEQAIILSNMELNIAEQAELIKQLTTKVEEQAIIIANTDLNIAEQAELIQQLTTKHKEQAIIINKLELNIHS